LELRKRVLALLDHALDHGLHARVVERTAGVDLALLDAGQRHPDHAQTGFVAAFHRGLHVFRETVLQRRHDRGSWAVSRAGDAL
jgi:hypothetical protein